MSPFRIEKSERLSATAATISSFFSTSVPSSQKGDSMRTKQIRMIAEFFYSSKSSKDVPFRIALVSGSYAGYDLNYHELIDLLEMLSNTTQETIKADMAEYLSRILD